MEEIDRRGTDDIVCPYCGYKITDCWEFNNDSDNINCDECEKPFYYEREYEITYSTTKISCKEKDNKEHLFTLRKDYPYHHSKRNFKNNEWVDLPKEEWKYYKIMECEDCDEVKYEDITEKEFLSQFVSPGIPTIESD